jgi:hypothetical protein
LPDWEKEEDLGALYPDVPLKFLYKKELYRICKYTYLYNFDLTFFTTIPASGGVQ